MCIASGPVSYTHLGRAVRVVGKLGIKLDYSVTPVLKMAISR